MIVLPPKCQFIKAGTMLLSCDVFKTLFTQVEKCLLLLCFNLLLFFYLSHLYLFSCIIVFSASVFFMCWHFQGDFILFRENDKWIQEQHEDESSLVLLCVV